jgi:hypothetical protein
MKQHASGKKIAFGFGVYLAADFPLIDDSLTSCHSSSYESFAFYSLSFKRSSGFSYTFSFYSFLDTSFFS